MNRRAIISSFKTALQSIGYNSRQIVDSYSFADFDDRRAIVNRIPLAAFSGYPCTYRNACIGLVFDCDEQSGADWVHRHRALGAPLIFEVGERKVQPWSIAPVEALPHGQPFPLDSLESAFQANSTIWNPSVLGRLKSASEVNPNPQLDFYDTGLMPVLKEFFQAKLKDLLERAFADTAAVYRSVHSSEPQVAYLFPFLFRFVTAKIFMDRADAQGWEGLDDPRKILDKAESHSGSGLLNKLPATFLDRRVLTKAWESISQTLHFQNLSVPDLVGIYEDLFIDEETRRKLGVHSTPVGLASYMVDHLPWEKVPVNQRVVLEGFCGHGVFLAQAMERLGRDLDPMLTPRQRHQYFQKMLIGVEKDPLAIEVCRLLLTLSDYPNDNSWQLYQEDVFDWPEWDAALRSASVVLANPPYESFPAEERERITATKAQPPAEFIHRVMKKPPAMLGLVLPQSFVTSPFFKEANRQIAQRYADVEIVELPPIFKYADNETVAVMASGLRDVGSHVSVYFSEVLPEGIDQFLNDFKVSRARTAKLSVPTSKQVFTLWIPPTGSVFNYISDAPSLGDVAKIRQGLHWIPRTDGKPRTALRTDVASDIPKKGFHPGAEKMAGNFSQLQLRSFRYLSTKPEHHHPRDKAWRNLWEKPKVVFNSCRFERKSPWRLAAWADSQGMAFTKAYFAIWPKAGISEFALAAILCSPLANAFCFERDLDRNNRIATLGKLPLPAVERLGLSGQLHHQAKRLQRLLSENSKTDQTKILEAVVRLDAAVLEAYDLPAHLQRQLLDQFEGWRRPIGVPFTEYFPKHFKDVLTLKDYVDIEYNWDATNERRCDLIEKEISTVGFTSDEREELDHLQHLADLLVRLKEPYPLDELGSLVAELKAKGKWAPSI